MTSKADVRQMIRERLRLEPEERARKSADICEAITADPAWRAAHTIALFAPTAAEPDVELLWPRAAGKMLCFPRMREREIDLLHVTDLRALAASRWQLREPLYDLAKVIDPGAVDLILVPGLGFTREGDRLGRGGGFYDRLLAHPRMRAVKIGVCFDVQLLETLPTEPHDARVDRVISA